MTVPPSMADPGRFPLSGVPVSNPPEPEVEPEVEAPAQPEVENDPAPAPPKGRSSKAK